MPAIDLRTLDPAAQGLGVDVQLARDPPDHHHALTLGRDRLQRHPRGPLPQLLAVLPLSCHDSSSSWNQSLHRTRGATGAYFTADWTGAGPQSFDRTEQ